MANISMLIKPTPYYLMAQFILHSNAAALAWCLMHPARVLWPPEPCLGKEQRKDPLLPRGRNIIVPEISFVQSICTCEGSLDPEALQCGLT